MAGQGRSERWVGSLAAGFVIGAVEVVLAVSFATLVFGGYLAQFLANGIGVYLLAAAITLAVLAWRAGKRGVVGSVQDAASAVLAVIAASTVLDAFGSVYRAFLTVVAATMVVTLLTGIAFFVLGHFRLGNLVRYVPYPVVGGFLAGTGWLLAKGGIGVAARKDLTIDNLKLLVKPFELQLWIPALAFGVLLLLAARYVKRPLAIPLTLAFGFVAFAGGMLLTGSSLDAAREGGWLLGPFDSNQLFQPWSLRAVSGADWSAVLDQAPGIATAIFVAVIAALFNVSGTELLLDTDLDSNRELRDIGIVNVAAGPFGGIPGYHALSLTSLAHRMNVGARRAGLVAALIPFAAVVVGGSAIQLIPRMVVGGVLVFVGLSLLVEWVLDIRRHLSIGEYVVVLVILVTIASRGFLPGVVVGLALAAALFAITYSRIESIREVAFGAAYRSNVDRPPAERAALQGFADRVEILRLNGFVFFGTGSRLVERIRDRADAAPLRFLVLDLMRVTGMDSSAVMSMRKVHQLAKARGFELVFTAVSDRVRRQLERGGVVPTKGLLDFEPDLDRGLERCEEAFLEESRRSAPGELGAAALDGLPEGLERYFERRNVPAGEALMRQGEAPDDIFVLESGRLSVELTTSDGEHVRLRAVQPGIVVGEVALYTGSLRTADVVATADSVVLALTRAEIERLERSNPELATELHRWLAKTLAERLSDTLRVLDTSLD